MIRQNLTRLGKGHKKIFRQFQMSEDALKFVFCGLYFIKTDNCRINFSVVYPDFFFDVQINTVLC